MPTETPAGAAQSNEPAPAGLGSPITHMTVRLPYVDSSGVFYASPLPGDRSAVTGPAPLNSAAAEIRRQETVTVEQRLRAEFDAETARQAGESV